MLLIFETLGMSVLVGVMQARSITRPLRKSSEATARISRGNLSAAVAVRSLSEVGTLASSINAMRSRLREFVRAIQEGAEHVAACSHGKASRETAARQIAAGLQGPILFLLARLQKPEP